MRALAPTFLAALLVACGGPEPLAPAVAPTPLAPAPVATEPPAGLSSSAPPAPAAEPRAEARALERPDGPSTGAAPLSRLPRGAAIYASVRPELLDTVVGWFVERPEDREEIAAALGAPSVVELIARMGLSHEQPLLVAVVPPDPAHVGKVVDAILAKKDVAAAERAVHAGAPTATLVRVVARLTKQARPVEVLEDLARSSRALRLRVERCPGAAACGTGAATPVAVVTASNVVMGLHFVDDTLEVDAIVPTLELPPRAIPSTLAAFRALPRTGPEPTRCAAFDARASVALCLDADRAAALGAAMGLGATASALANGAVDPSFRAPIAKQGKQESLRNLELAAAKRRLLDDGTLVALANEERVLVVGSWATTAASRDALHAAYASERCSVGRAVASEQLAALRRVLTDPGADFADAAARFEHVREAGWGGWLVVAARVWPNLLGPLEKPVALSPQDLVDRACVREVGGRLELEAHVRVR